MKKINSIYKVIISFVFLFITNAVTAQVNVGLSAVVTQSGGGSGSISGPGLYNDNVIPAPGGLPSGFVTSNGWIEFTWSTPQIFNKVVFHKGSGVMSSCLLEYWNGSSYVSIGNYNNTVTPNDAITFPPVTTTKFRMNNVVAISGNPRFREIQVLNAYNNDIGVVAIDSISKSFCSGAKNVYATIANMGLNQVTNCTINWEINGIAQPAVSYNGLIDTFRATSSDTIHVKLGTITALPNTTYLIKAWTSNPNNQTDPFIGNDLAQGNLKPALNGIYTIGSGGNYSTFYTAVADLNNYGVCGPVIFNVLSGTFNEQVLLSPIQGASASNTITFQSTANDADSVVLSYAGASSSNYIIKFNGASFINLKKISFKPLGTTLSNAVVLASTASNDSITNCKISSAAVTSGFPTPEQCGIYGTSLSGSNIVIDNNIISGGSYGIYIYGVTSPRGNNYRILDNIILNNYNYGIYCNYVNRLKITNNRISLAAPVYTSCYGITCQSCDTEMLINNNRVIANVGSATVYGLNITSCYNSQLLPGLILNNSIAVTSTGNTYGLYSATSGNLNYYNNSINSTSINAINYTAYFSHNSASDGGINFRNNIFSNLGGGKVLYNKNTSYVVGDYNNLFTSGGILVERGTPAGNYNTLTDWKAASGQEMNSISYRPPYISSIDLQPNPADTAAWSINGRGIHLNGNIVDINGNARSTTLAAGVPDLGAYEFVPNAISPAAIAIPSTAIPGTSQYFLFGEDTVAKIDWNSSSVIPANLTVRAYTGEKPPLLNIPTYMYSYIDVGAANGSYNYNLSMFYRHAWLGTNSTDKALKLAKKDSGVPWNIYAGTQSSVDSSRRVIIGRSTLLPSIFTGIDSLAVIPICTAPAGLSISNIKDTSADASWGNVVNINGYEYAISQSAIPPVMGNATINTSYSLRGLTNNTTYYFHLRTACKNGDFSNWVTKSFTTASCSMPNTVITNTGPLTFCQGDSTILSVTPGIGYTYKWKLGGNDILGATSSSYIAKNSGNYTVEITNSICIATSTAITVNVGIVSASITVLAGGFTTFCDGSPCTLRATSGSGLTYQWRYNGNDINGATTAIYLPDKGSGDYTVKVSNGTCSGISVPTTITVVPLPSAHLVSVQGKSILCDGDSVVLTAAINGSYSSYQWTNNGFLVPGATGLTCVAKYAGDYALKVVYQMCTTGSEDTVIVIHPLPSAVIKSLDDNIFCHGDSTLLNAYAGSNMTYRWKNYGANIPNATNSTYIAKETGKYSVVVNSSTCADTSAEYEVIVHVLPTPIINSGDGINLRTDDYLTYQWNLGGAKIPGANSKNYKALVNGDYSVTVTDSNGCSNTSQPYHVGTVNVNDILVTQNGIKLYPNPVTDILYMSNSANIAIFNIEGKLLLRGDDITQISLASLPEGVYVAKLYDDNGIIIKFEKVLKSRF